MRTGRLLFLSALTLAILAGCSAPAEPKGEAEEPTAASSESGSAEKAQPQEEAASAKKADGADVTGPKTVSTPVAKVGEKDAKPAASAKNPVNEAYDKARELAKKENKLLLVTFSATWCPPCKELEKAMKDDLLFTEELKHYQAIKVDIDDEDSKDLKEKFYPDGGIPFIIVLRPEDESRVTDALGFDSTIQMVKLLKSGREKA